MFYCWEGFKFTQEAIRKTIYSGVLRNSFGELFIGVHDPACAVIKLWLLLICSLMRWTLNRWFWENVKCAACCFDRLNYGFIGTVSLVINGIHLCNCLPMMGCRYGVVSPRPGVYGSNYVWNNIINQYITRQTTRWRINIWSMLHLHAFLMHACNVLP